MFDNVKLLKEILKISLIVLVLLLVVRIFGVSITDIHFDKTLATILVDHGIEIPYMLISLFAFGYMFLRIVCEHLTRNKAFIFALLLSLVTAGIQFLVSHFEMYEAYFPLSMLTLYLFMVIINRKLSIKRFAVVIVINLLYQVIALLIRDITLLENYENSAYDFIMNIDYIILCIITYNIYIRDRDWIKKSFLRIKKIKPSIKKKAKSINIFEPLLDSLKNKPKSEKISLIIYYILNFIWNVLTIALVLFVSKLNGTLIECILIIVAFSATKYTFGTPFHFKSMIACFIVSNIVFYSLNQITTTIGISYFIPLIIGVLLSYITSKFVKEKDRNL